MKLIVALTIIVISLGINIDGYNCKVVQFIFGDSLSDVGNNARLSKSLAQASLPWYGIDFGSGMPNGRFTNGRTVADIIGDKTGLPRPPAFLDPTLTEDVILEKGLNFASGGGGILNETGGLFIQRFSLYKQIELFQGTRELMKAKMGTAAADKFFQESRYVVALGSNDFINNYLVPVYSDSWTYNDQGFIDYLMETLQGQLKTMGEERKHSLVRWDGVCSLKMLEKSKHYGAQIVTHLFRTMILDMLLHRLGARQLMVFGLGPMGCIPLQRVLSLSGECQDQTNNLALGFNKAATKLLEDLSSSLPNASFRFGDAYDVVSNVITNPSKYGFSNSDSPCCSFGRIRPALTCVPASTLCKDRRKYLFWDEYHPTDTANELIANEIIKRLGFTSVNNSNGPSPAPAFAPSTDD